MQSLTMKHTVMHTEDINPTSVSTARNPLGASHRLTDILVHVSKIKRPISVILVTRYIRQRPH